jgi:hypothetical protein
LSPYDCYNISNHMAFSHKVQCTQV